MLDPRSIVARRMHDAIVAHRSVGAFNIVSCAYDGTNRVWPHRTLKAAWRRLGSVADGRGKLNRAGDFAAVVVTPDGRFLNWNEIKAAINAP